MITSRLAVTATVALLALSACGGGSDSADSDGGGSDDSGASAEDQPAATISSEEICTAVPGDQFVPSVAEATGVIDTPSGTTVGCSYQFANIEASVLDAQVMVENEGGQAGYDAVVADWSSRGEATVVPGVGDAATIVDSGSRRLIVLDGDRVIAVNGPVRESFGFTAELATEMAVAAVAAL